MLKRERAVAMRSPVNWTVLGLVIERQSYGWELWKRFERLYGDVLAVGSDSNIYAALNKLRENGFIEEVEGSRSGVPDATRQPKPHYRATVEGLEAYEAWSLPRRANTRVACFSLHASSVRLPTSRTRLLRSSAATSRPAGR